jgi:hypothetical protein
MGKRETAYLLCIFRAGLDLKRVNGKQHVSLFLVKYVMRVFELENSCYFHRHYRSKKYGPLNTLLCRLSYGKSGTDSATLFLGKNVRRDVVNFGH